MPNSCNVSFNCYEEKKKTDINRLKTSLFSTDSQADVAVFDTIFQRSPDNVTNFLINSMSMTKTHTIHTQQDSFFSTQISNHLFQFSELIEEYNIKFSHYASKSVNPTSLDNKITFLVISSMSVHLSCHHHTTPSLLLLLTPGSNHLFHKFYLP